MERLVEGFVEGLMKGLAKDPWKDTLRISPSGGRATCHSTRYDDFSPRAPMGFEPNTLLEALQNSALSLPGAGNPKPGATVFPANVAHIRTYGTHAGASVRTVRADIRTYTRTGEGAASPARPVFGTHTPYVRFRICSGLAPGLRPRALHRASWWHAFLCHFS